MQSIRVSFDVFVQNDINPDDAAIYLGGDHFGLDSPIGIDEEYPEGVWAIRAASSTGQRRRHLRILLRPGQ